MLPRRLETFTDHTITDRAVLFNELEKIRETGIAYDHQEFTIGIASVGTPVRDAVGAFAAVAVVVPVTRFDDSVSEIAAALTRTRDEIQTVLNGG